jgi:hypothetical protein
MARIEGRELLAIQNTVQILGFIIVPEYIDSMKPGDTFTKFRDSGREFPQPFTIAGYASREEYAIQKQIFAQHGIELDDFPTYYKAITE